jgi:hypothetical protein
MPPLERIQDEDRLLRRVPHTDPNYIKPDGTLSSFAFSLKKNEEGLSVNIERLTTYEATILDKSRFRLYVLSASEPRSLGLDCLHDPKPENDAHALITGSITKSISRQLAAKARRASYPE